MSLPPFAAEPYGAVTAEMLEAELIVVIRHDRVTMADLRELFDTSFGALHSAAKSGLFVPVGPALAIYHGDPQETFDLEIGFPAMGAPTNAIPTPAGVIHASALPAGPVSVLSHIGDFGGLGASWGALISGAASAPLGIYIEAYISDPATTPADNLRTDLILPLRSA